MKIYTIQLNERELATVLWGLRYRQACLQGRQIYAGAPDCNAFADLATGGGMFAALNVNEIEELCAKLFAPGTWTATTLD